MPRFDFQGTSIHAETAGTAGTPILFLHGLGCGARMWLHQMSAFAGSNRVIALDFPGHGQSAPRRQCSEDIFADLSIHVLDQLNIDRAVLVGLSMGGGVALATVLRHPDRVSGVLAADAGSGSDDADGGRAMALGMAKFVRENGIAAYAETMANSPGIGAYARMGERQRDHIPGILTDNDAEGIPAVIEGIQAVRPTMQARPLQTIAVPTTILVGENDLVCINASNHAATVIPGAELVVLPGVGHMSALEAPAAFNTALQDLLARVA